MITIAAWVAAIATVIFQRMILPAARVVVTIFHDAAGLDEVADADTAAVKPKTKRTVKPKVAAATKADVKPSTVASSTPVLTTKVEVKPATKRTRKRTAAKPKLEVVEAAAV